METYLGIGGLIAAGFDADSTYLLTVSHSGRGVFSTRTWERVARDKTPIYPEQGVVPGIGPIDGIDIPVTEMNYEEEKFHVVSPDGRITLNCESSGIAISISPA